MLVVGRLRPEVRRQVVMQQQYQSWMRSFGAGAQHLVVNQKAAGSFPVLTSACSLQVTFLPYRIFGCPLLPSLSGLPLCSSSFGSQILCDWLNF